MIIIMVFISVRYSWKSSLNDTFDHKKAVWLLGFLWWTNAKYLILYAMSKLLNLKFINVNASKLNDFYWWCDWVCF